MIKIARSATKEKGMHYSMFRKLITRRRLTLVLLLALLVGAISCFSD